MIIDYRVARPQPAAGWRIYDVETKTFVDKPVFYANDETGEYAYYLRDAGGGFYLDKSTMKPAQEWRHGRILIVAPGQLVCLCPRGAANGHLPDCEWIKTNNYLNGI